jgi:hypothetical protein
LRNNSFLREAFFAILRFLFSGRKKKKGDFMKQQLSRKRSGLLRRKVLFCFAFCFAANRENQKRKKQISKKRKEFLKKPLDFSFFFVEQKKRSRKTLSKASKRVFGSPRYERNR